MCTLIKQQSLLQTLVTHKKCTFKLLHNHNMKLADSSVNLVDQLKMRNVNKQKISGRFQVQK